MDLKKQLEKVKSDNLTSKNPNLLKDYVINYIINDDDDIKAFFNDLRQGGCVSGMVSSLIYYKDTHNFYDTFYYEIENLRIEYEESIGEPVKIDNNDLKNQLAWYSFQETAYKLYQELNLDN